MKNFGKNPPDSGEIFSAIGLLIGVALVATLGYFLFSNLGNVRDFIRKTDTYPLAISTTPTDAMVFLDNREIGKSPVTTLTYPGAHVVSIRKDGYATFTKAIELAQDQYSREKDGSYRLTTKGSPWSFNFDLQPSAHTQPSIAVGNVGPDKIAGLEKQITDLRSTIIANPDQALSYGLLKSRVDALERENASLREQAGFSSNLMLVIWGTLVAIFLTLIPIALSRKRSAP